MTPTPERLSAFTQDHLSALLIKAHATERDTCDEIAEALWPDISAHLRASPQGMTEEERVIVLRDALEFYADPDTWFAVALFGDRPCGEITEDFSVTEKIGDEEIQRPGKRAREALDKFDRLSSASPAPAMAVDRDQFDRLHKYVWEAAVRFREYETSHRAKGTEDGDYKAVRNQLMASRGEEMLGLIETMAKAISSGLVGAASSPTPAVDVAFEEAMAPRKNPRHWKFANHNCAGCGDGARPCKEGDYGNCSWPHARND